MTSLLQEPLVHSQSLRPGLSLHYTRHYRQAPDSAEHVLAPGLNLMLIWEGESAALLGGQRLHAAARGDKAAGLRYALREPALLHRQSRRPGAQSKLVLSLGEDWLDDYAGQGAVLLPAKSAAPVSIQAWQPSIAACRLARALLSLHADAGFLERLQAESQAVALVANAFQAGEAPLRALHAREQRRLENLRERLENDEDLPGLEQLARELGSNSSSLQARFKTAYGCTIYEYRKEYCLQQAREALIQGMRVGEAAALAGYGNAANFATAFKRRFGCRPREAGGADESLGAQRIWQASSNPKRGLRAKSLLASP